MPSSRPRLRPGSLPPLLALTVALAACKLDHRGRSEDLSTHTDTLTTTAHLDAGVEIRALLIQSSYDRGEWVELRNTADRDVALGGWRLESGGDPGFTFPEGSLIHAGGRFDLGLSREAHRTGGVRVRLIMEGIVLADRNDWLALRDRSGRTIDSVAWTSSSSDMPLTHRSERAPQPRQ